MGVRHQGRETALQILYIVDIGRLSFEEASKACASTPNLPSHAHQFANQLAEEALSHRKDLDDLIARYAENWEISRMAAVDRNIIRLAAHELLHCPETPVAVIIDEAVEMAKTYSTEDSGKFVNGILDKIKSHREISSGESC
jgi:N utilization substance protein B